MSSDKKNVRTIKASRLLQAKVGIGPVDEKKIARSQKLIDENDVDFKPLAQEYLDELDRAIRAAREGKGDSKALIDGLIPPVMQIKANASIFGYALIGSLANVMLNFLETIDAIDKDVIEIVEAHQKTLNLIIANGMKGAGGAFGKELTTELKEACKRYFAKRAGAGKPIDDKDAFFIDG